MSENMIPPGTTILPPVTIRISVDGEPTGEEHSAVAGIAMVLKVPIPPGRRIHHPDNLEGGTWGPDGARLPVMPDGTSAHHVDDDGTKRDWRVYQVDRDVIWVETASDLTVEITTEADAS